MFKKLVTGGIALLLLAGCSSPQSRPTIDYQPGELSGADPQFGEKLAGCMREAGWDVTVGPDGSVGMSMPESQGDAYDASLEACTAQLGFDSAPPALSDEQLKRLYQANLALVGCLESQGFTISDIPSEQAYLDGALFDPYSELLNPAAPGHLTDDEHAALREKCPAP